MSDVDLSLLPATTERAVPVSDSASQLLLERILINVRAMAQADPIAGPLLQALVERPVPTDYPLPAEQVEVLLAALAGIRLDHDGLTDAELRAAPLQVIARFDDQQLKDLRQGPIVRGGGGVAAFPARMVERITEAVAGVTTIETRLDYDDRDDEQPVYVGRAERGADTAAASWTIEKITYDGTDRPVRKQVQVAAWDDRTTLTW